MEDLNRAASILKRVLDEVGGPDNLTVLLRAPERGVGSPQEAGAADAVAEAVLLVAETVTPEQAFEVAEAIESFGGPFAIASAMDAARGSLEVAEAVDAAGGTLEIARALAAPSRVVLAQLMGGNAAGNKL